jgi:hypothetical protein
MSVIKFNNRIKGNNEAKIDKNNRFSILLMLTKIVDIVLTNGD